MAYIIKKGDTLTSIAKQYGTTVGALAAANNIKDVNVINAGASLNIPGQKSTTVNNTTSAAAANNNTSANLASTNNANTNASLKGVSENTQANLNKYNAGYTQSNAVTAAENYLNQVKNNKPGEFSSAYTEQMNNLYNQILNRDKFKYDLDSDMLYNQAKDQYTALGKQAMQDTMGQAAALTGGYGNSYASTAGNQAYQNYLSQLNDNIPEYYQMAMSNYNNETEALNNKYSVAKNLYDTDYSNYRDKVSDYQNDYANAYNAFTDTKNFDYNDYNTMLNYWQNQAGNENNDYWTQTNYDESVKQYNEQLAYQKSQDALAQSQWQQEFDYQKQQDAISNALAKQSTSTKTTNSSGITDKQLQMIAGYGSSGQSALLGNYLDNLVSSGVITESQADKYYDLYNKNDKAKVSATAAASVKWPSLIMKNTLK